MLKIVITKSLSERIAQRVNTKKQSRTGKNRVSFLAVRDDVRKALDDGWSVKMIWDTLHNEGKIEFGYDAFIGYVNRLIRNMDSPRDKKPDESMKANKLTLKMDKAKTVVLQERKAEVSSFGGFNFNPKPNKEDLL